MSFVKNSYHVRDLLIDDEFDVITSDLTVKEAALKMKELGIPDLVVVDEEKKVLGVIADYDIVIGTVATGKLADKTKVTESMYKIESVMLDTPVEVAFARMQELDVSAVPVIDKHEKIIGIVTITDCWGYLPEKYEDYEGLLTVSNVRFVNYWFTIGMTVLYFFFGILSPLIGITGFLKSELIVSVSNTPFVTYGLFEAKGGEYFIRYIDFINDNVIWTSIFAYSIFFIIIGILVALIMFQWAYSDYHLIKQSRKWETIGFALGIINAIVIWSLFFIVNNLGIARTGESKFDEIGIIFTLLSIIFLTLAVSRDFFFKQSEEVSNKGKHK